MTYYAHGRLYHECKELKENNQGMSCTLCKMELYTWDYYWRMDIIDQDDKFVARFDGNISHCPFCGIRLKDANEKEYEKRFNILSK